MVPLKGPWAWVMYLKGIHLYFKACFDATHFWPLRALLRADWKEDELAVIDCRPIIHVTFWLYVQLATAISYKLVGYSRLNRPECTTCWLNTETYPYWIPHVSAFFFFINFVRTFWMDWLTRTKPPLSRALNVSTGFWLSTKKSFVGR